MRLYRMRLKTTLGLVAFALASARADWKPTSGPLGTNLESVFIDDGLCLAGTREDGIYRSQDLGRTWEKARMDTGTQEVWEFTVLEGTYFARAVSGLLRSEDKGQSWTRMLPGRYFNAMTVSGAFLILHGNEGLFRSADKGTTLTPADSGMGKRIVHVLAAGDSGLFAGASHAGIFRSRDHGATWTRAGTWVPGLIMDLAVSGGTLLVSTHGGGLAASRDAGASWTVAHEKLPVGFFSEVAIQGQDWFAAAVTPTGNGGIYRSIDEGGTWQPLRQGLLDLSPMALAAEKGLVLSGGSGGLFRSTDRGELWSWVGFGRSDTRFILAHAGGLLAGGMGGGVFRSLDRGDTWTSVNAGLGDGYLLSLEEAGGILFAGTANGGAYRSLDGAQTWRPLGKPLDSVKIEAFVHAGGAHFAGGEGGIYRSLDQGATWLRISDGSLSGTPHCLLPVGDTLFAGLNGAAVYRSLNGGISWTPSHQGLPLVHTYTLAKIDGQLLAGNDKDVFRSLDGGLTWSLLARDLPGAVFSLARAGSQLLAATSEGIFRKAPADTAWVPENQGLPEGQSVFVLRIAGSDLYAGGMGMGVWRRPLAEIPLSTLSSHRDPSGPGFRNQASRFLFPDFGTAAASSRDALGRLAPAMP